jgi:Ca2+-binding RTX toxin-like protein
MAKAPEEVTFDPVYGTSGNDVIYEKWGSVDYYGKGGNDVFIAQSKDSFVAGSGYLDSYFYGDSGSDTISYQSSSVKINANLDAELVTRSFSGSKAVDHVDSVENLIGSNHNDTIYGSDGANYLWGFGGNDLIYGLNGHDHISGDSGNDTLGGGSGNDVVDGGTGNDDLEGATGDDTLSGGDGNDTMHGSGSNDVLKGGANDDQLFGQSGNDRLEGGSGADLLDGGTGTDTAVYTGASKVTIDLVLGTATGAWGSDTLVSIERIETGSGNDQILAGDGGLWLSTGAGKDLIFGSDEDDIVYSGADRDIVYGYGGDDEVYASTGNDVVNGGDGDDKLYGESGQDEIEGGNGDDTLYGGAGSDLIRGGDGFDTINGGTGPDLIVWGNGDGDGGADTIVGFNLNEDKLWFENGFFDHDAIGPLNLEDVLTVIDSGPDAILGANTADSGWTYLAVFTNVDANALSMKIANGSILAPSGVDLGDLIG